MVRPSRDPETRRAIRRLETQLHETRDIHDAERLLRKLLALYSELGDARGAIRCKTDLKRLDALIDRVAQRKRRRPHRTPRSEARMVRRKPVSPPEREVVWSKDDLALVDFGNKGFLLVRERPWGPTVVGRFPTRNHAIAYLIEEFGPLFFKDNDPDSLRARRR